MRHVAFLGSINVGGNRLKMTDLKAALEQAGLANVETVTASGNVLFDHDLAKCGAADEALVRQIAKVVQDSFGIDCTVVVRTRDELAAAIAANPFAADGQDNMVHTVFLDGPLDRAAFEAFVQGYDGPERLAPGDHAFHVDFVDGVGRSKLDPAMCKARVVTALGTARNLRSMKRILEKMDD